MAAGRYSFNIEQGSTTQFEFRWQDSAKSSIDLHGYEAAMQLRTNYSQSGGTTALTITSSMGDTYTKGSGSAFLSLSGSDLSTSLLSGSIGVYIGYNETSKLTADEYFYDLELTHPATEQRWRLVEGKINDPLYKAFKKTRFRP